MEIEMLPKPSGGRGRESILDPPGHRVTLQGTITRNGKPLFPEELFSEFLIFSYLTPKSIQVAQALVKMVPDVRWPVTQLGVQIVVVITFPRWQITVIRSPYRLERDWIRVLPGGRSELVHFPVVLVLDKGVGNLNSRLLPERVPILHVPFIGLCRAG